MEALNRNQILEKLNSGNKITKIQAIKKIPTLKSSGQKECLLKALSDKEFVVSEEARKLIHLRRVGNIRLEKDFIISILQQTKNPKRLSKVVKLIPLLRRKEDQVELIWSCYCLFSGEVKEAAKMLLSIVYNNTKRRSVKRRIEKDLPTLNDFNLSSHPLYSNIEDKFLYSSKIQRRLFKNDESKTFLLGGHLAGKTIIRIISYQAFIAWKKAWSAETAWLNSDFTYTPVEPIQFEVSTPKKLKRVYCEVLDMTLGDLNYYFNFFKYLPQLHEQKKQILSILKKLNIIHGHPHNRNFCVKFFRFPDGKINDQICPKLYIIDFDKAYIKQKQA